MEACTHVCVCVGLAVWSGDFMLHSTWRKISDLDTTAIFILFWRISQATQGKLCPPARAVNLFLYQHYCWCCDDDWGEVLPWKPCRNLWTHMQKYCSHASMAVQTNTVHSNPPTQSEGKKTSPMMKSHYVTVMKLLGHIFVSLAIYSSGRLASKWLNKQNSLGLCKYRGKCSSHFSNAQQNAFHTSFLFLNTLNSQYIDFHYLISIQFLH